MIDIAIRALATGWTLTAAANAQGRGQRAGVSDRGKLLQELRIYRGTHGIPNGAFGGHFRRKSEQGTLAFSTPELQLRQITVLASSPPSERRCLAQRLDGQTRRHPGHHAGLRDPKLATSFQRCSASDRFGFLARHRGMLLAPWTRLKWSQAARRPRHHMCERQPHEHRGLNAENRNRSSPSDHRGRHLNAASPF